MDQQTEQLLKSLNRQLRGIKLLFGFFFIMFIAMLAVLGYITYRVITFTNDVTTKINNFQSQTSETLDLKKQLCDNKSLSNFLQNKSEVCK